MARREVGDLNIYIYFGVDNFQRRPDTYIKDISAPSFYYTKVQGFLPDFTFFLALFLLSGDYILPFYRQFFKDLFIFQYALIKLTKHRPPPCKYSNK